MQQCPCQWPPGSHRTAEVPVSKRHIRFRPPPGPVLDPGAGRCNDLPIVGKRGGRAVSASRTQPARSLLHRAADCTAGLSYRRPGTIHQRPSRRSQRSSRSSDVAQKRSGRPSSPTIRIFTRARPGASTRNSSTSVCSGTLRSKSADARIVGQVRVVVRKGLLGSEVLAQPGIAERRDAVEAAALEPPVELGGTRVEGRHVFGGHHLDLTDPGGSVVAAAERGQRDGGHVGKVRH